jgi:hypothetical protein
MPAPIIAALLPSIVDIAGKIFDRVIPDKAAAEAAKLELLKEAQSNEFTLALKQIETNIEEAKHASIWVAGWRPFIGWVCGTGLAWNFVGYPVANWIIAIWFPDYSAPELFSDNLMELTLAMLGMAGLRSWEKFKGIA